MSPDPSLPAADKLAKDPQNSLIVIFLVDGTSIVGMTIMPVIDAALGEILRALRKCDVEAPREYGRRNVSLSLAGTGVDVAPTPEALRSALVGFGEEDAFAHAARKRGQVQSLGYGARPIVGTFKAVGDDADMVSFFLGEKAVDVKDLTTREYRFGIPREILRSVEGATMRLDAPWVTNVVTFGSKLARGRVSLDGKVFVMPYSKLGRRTIRVVTDALQFDVTDDSARFSPVERNSSTRLSLQSRLKTCQAYEYMTMGRTTFMVRLDNEKRFEVTSDDPEQPHYLQAYRAHHMLLREFLDVVHAAGLEDYDVSDDVIEKTAEKLSSLHVHLSRTFAVMFSNLARTTAEKIPDLPSPGLEIDAYVIDHISLDEHIISYYFVGRARLFDHDAHVNIEIKECVIRDIRFLGNDGDAYNAYAEEVGRDYLGAVGIIMNTSPDHN